MLLFGSFPVFNQITDRRRRRRSKRRGLGGGRERVAIFKSPRPGLRPEPRFQSGQGLLPAARGSGGVRAGRAMGNSRKSFILVAFV